MGNIWKKSFFSGMLLIGLLLVQYTEINADDRNNFFNRKTRQVFQTPIQAPQVFQMPHQAPQVYRIPSQAPQRVQLPTELQQAFQISTQTPQRVPFPQGFPETNGDITILDNRTSRMEYSNYRNIIDKGKAAYNSANRDTSISLFNQAISLLNTGDDKKQKQDALVDIGLFLRDIGDIPNAITYLNRAVDTAIINDDNAAIQNILTTLEPLFIEQETQGIAPFETPMSDRIPVKDESFGQFLKILSYFMIAVNAETQTNRYDPIPRVEFPEDKTAQIPKVDNYDMEDNSPSSEYTQPPEVAIEIDQVPPSSSPQKQSKAKPPKSKKKNITISNKNASRATVIVARENSMSEVLPCKGPTANNKAYEDLYVKKEWATNYINPVPYGRYAPYEGDTGLDIIAPRGYPIYASKGGVVLYSSPAGHCRQKGPQDDQGAIRIRHSDGTDTFYAHLSGRRNSLQAGSRIKQGQWIGNIGKANKVPHLHFTIYYSDSSYEGPFATPSKLLNPWPAVASNR